MGLSQAALDQAVAAAAQIEPRFSVTLERIGLPETRSRPRGYETILRTIVGQQVSVKAAASIWRKLEEGIGDLSDPAVILASGEDALRACGLSRQKQSYAHSLAALVVSGELDLHNLPEDDEEAIALLTRAKGIGRWSAEIYLLFAEGRADIWPAGDLAIQIAIGRMLGMEARPSEKVTRNLAEAWRPYRGGVAIFAWHEYNIQAI